MVMAATSSHHISFSFHQPTFHNPARRTSSNEHELSIYQPPSPVRRIVGNACNAIKNTGQDFNKSHPQTRARRTHTNKSGLTNQA